MQIRIKENPSMCQQRKSIVEHPFGTLKHTMGHRYFLMKGEEKVSAENEYVGIGYNMKRVMNVIGIINKFHIQFSNPYNLRHKVIHASKNDKF